MQTIGEPTRFGALLQQYRRRIGYTQTELAGFSTVSVRAIRNLELGRARNPRRETVRLLADTLRLAGEQRAALLLAAGHEADDASFDALPPRPALAARPVHGRAREVGRLVEWLRAEPRARIRVTGLGGVGKTRVALAAAHVLRTEDRMPVLWVALSDGDRADGRGASGGRLPSAVRTGLLAGEAAAAETARLIGDRSVLLVLDGDDEGLVPAGTVERLLDGCRNLRVVETVRHPRGGHREPTLALGPLPAPAPTSLAAQEPGPALAVLLDRAAELRADVGTGPGTLADLLEICARLDGVPRALESAAHWLLLSTPAELVRTARSEPHVLATPPGTGDPAGGWVHEAARHAVAALSPAHRDLLHRLAARGRPWTMEELATGSAGGAVNGLGEAAAAVHALLHSGLVRRTASERTVAFDLLTLVRGCLPAPESAATPARPDADHPAPSADQEHPHAPSEPAHRTDTRPALRSVRRAA
ncbi:helix-turn-helix domain-containing protein [Streptomyces sp. enrichment culture]|uniref:helix-turn-helix domain-containing protein n=1 Tax=Streptomyces sp. enrichment culture TaxID=1795815 RepID=UPI003F56BEDF